MTMQANLDLGQHMQFTSVVFGKISSPSGLSPRMATSFVKVRVGKQGLILFVIYERHPYTIAFSCNLGTYLQS